MRAWGLGLILFFPASVFSKSRIKKEKLKHVAHVERRLMPKIAYREVQFEKKSLALIKICNAVIAEYDAQGFQLTLRQLYYQMVSRNVIPNQQKEYKRLGSVVNDARMTGLIDWLAIEDRTRNLRRLAHWNDPSEIIQDAAGQYRIDLWAEQVWRPEIWIEKDALAGVISGICAELDVPYFSCRGYTSQSEMWGAGQRLQRWIEGGQTPIIFHFGDHDPSGRDMTRDIKDRLELFMGGVELQRLALLMDQVRKYNPPPNPAKTTDSRYAGYIEEFGTDSWELDALEPRVIVALIRSALTKLINRKPWDAHKKEIASCRAILGAVASHWGEIEERYGK